jgi:N-methylhydantoinase B/oxoprolinase/acetone carboxylase alpha subunit
VGHNILRRADGTEVELPSKGTWQLTRGDRIRIETPGGGGWGKPSPDVRVSGQRPRQSEPSHHHDSQQQ